MTPGGSHGSTSHMGEAMRKPRTYESYPTVILLPRTPQIGEWVTQCAQGKLEFADLCIKVAGLGYKTTSLYEMGRAEEQRIKSQWAGFSKNRQE